MSRVATGSLPQQLIGGGVVRLGLLRGFCLGLGGSSLPQRTGLDKLAQLPALLSRQRFQVVARRLSTDQVGVRGVEYRS